MTARRIFAALSPVRSGWRCNACGYRAVSFFELPKDCRRAGARECPILALWARAALFVSALVAVIGGVLWR